MTEDECREIYMQAIKLMKVKGGLSDAYVLQALKDAGRTPEEASEASLRLLRINPASLKSDSVEALLRLVRIVKPPEDYGLILAALLLCTNHQRNEDIAFTLQQLRDPRTVDSLYQAALSIHDHLHYDEFFNVARKCTWALADIGTPDAFERLQRLATLDNDVIAKYAQKRIAKWDQEKPRKASINSRIMASTPTPQPSAARLSYEDSCKVLERYGLTASDEAPPMPPGIPRHDAEVLGVSFFRTRIEGAVLENLTLPRTFFGRSRVERSSFADSDLTESNLTWNDFKNVSFRGAKLGHADLRASSYENCDFTGCDLSDADFRRTSFKNCNFERATLSNTILPRRLKKTCKFSKDQESQASWVFLEGAMPEGG